MCPEDAGLGAGEGTTTGSAFTFEGIGACERTTDDTIGSAFTLKGMSACEGTTDDAMRSAQSSPSKVQLPSNAKYQSEENSTVSY